MGAGGGNRASHGTAARPAWEPLRPGNNESKKRGRKWKISHFRPLSSQRSPGAGEQRPVNHQPKNGNKPFSQLSTPGSRWASASAAATTRAVIKTAKRIHKPLLAPFFFPAGRGAKSLRLPGAYCAAQGLPAFLDRFLKLLGPPPGFFPAHERKAVFLQQRQCLPVQKPFNRLWVVRQQQQRLAAAFKKKPPGKLSPPERAVPFRKHRRVHAGKGQRQQTGYLPGRILAIRFG